jgi:uncharacterized protein YkwD
MDVQKLGVCVLAAAALLVSAGSGEPLDPAIAALLAAHNRERKQEGRGLINLSAKLSGSAAIHALDMAKHHKLEHSGSDGSTVFERVKRKCYAFVRVGENIARGQKTVEDVMSSWMKSPGHRANILSDFTEFGAARADDDERITYWCVNFGIPMPRLNPAEAVAAAVKRVNRDRDAAQQPALKADPALGRAAMAISVAMAAKDSLDLDDPFKLIDEKATRGREFRLQFNAGAPTPTEAIKSLHGEEADELSSFREIGVGYAIAKSGTPYWCVILTKPAESKPPGVPKKARLTDKKKT